MPAAASGLRLPPAALLNGASLFLDFDGTLVEIEATPDAVVVDDALRLLLRRLAVCLDGRLALVSGRSVAELERLFGDLPFVVGGSHGLELRWPDGTATSPPEITVLPPVVAAMHRLRDRWPGIVVEEKPYGVALHYRGAPEAEGACRALAAELADTSGLSLQAGKMVLELRLRGADKGSAITTLMAAPALAGTAPVFVGDDDTDEAGFVAAAMLGGSGVLVGPARPTSASYRLGGVAATRAWLAACVDAS
ncbi:MAG: trehalose-phosphatase [Janthinobacterium lividum]